jgi:hypothetical protein
MTRDELMELASKANERYMAMTPEQRAIHDRDQRRSWVRGNIGIECPESEAPAIARRVERLLGKDGT